MAEVTIETLTELLKEAEVAHAQYEKELGTRDEAWPNWYARYIVEHLG